MTIDILLATYNGEKYLPEQLDSILQQTNHDWRIVARDDGSTDRTRSILHEYAEKVNAKYGKGKFVILLNDDIAKAASKDKCIIRNFSHLMEWSKEDGKADHIMFSDQDDVWYPDKIEKTLNAMRRAEARSGSGTPIVVRTDVALVDADGAMKTPSYMKARRYKPQHETFRSELVESTFQGCTMMMNRPLLELATPVPDAARMHDMWVGLVAAAMGKQELVPEPTMAYRQHANNVVGARNHLSYTQQLRRVRTVLYDFTQQAEALRERLGEQMPPQVRGDLDLYLKISREKQPMRGYHLAQEGFARSSWKENVALFGGSAGKDHSR